MINIFYSRSTFQQRETAFHLPETSEELFIGDAAIAIDVVVLHEGLDLNLLWEKSTD